MSISEAPEAAGLYHASDVVDLQLARIAGEDAAKALGGNALCTIETVRG